jgi:hypothetical protein
MALLLPLSVVFTVTFLLVVVEAEPFLVVSTLEEAAAARIGDDRKLLLWRIIQERGFGF